MKENVETGMGDQPLITDLSSEEGQEVPDEVIAIRRVLWDL
jgi:hypothetical protein